MSVHQNVNLWLLHILRGGVEHCHTRFLCKNRVPIVCVPRNEVYTQTIHEMDTE
jgi:hypothetical protein